MRKKIYITCIAIVIATIAWNVSLSLVQGVSLSNVALQNIEALADESFTSNNTGPAEIIVCPSGPPAKYCMCDNDKPCTQILCAPCN
jgi:hypothetical protein